MKTNQKNLIEEIVDGQLDAYNKGDYAAFATYYSEDVISYDLETCRPNPQMSGASFFAHYKKKLIDNPKIHCRVIQRIVHGNLVIDKEIISNCRGRDYEDLVIYEVDNEKISKMWFGKEIFTEGLSGK